ncbi:lantibiotic dehydratase [Ligilactobacillus cholophilus]|uniref:lantibiotic dehydratase n=1 Tax=Ligilactobacillus cholophilus TaxID=3050131 RepID=UPI0025AFABEE|nr:lantibiotic dehydratase [Ligilactobacillus cholophilus]
MNNYDLSNYFMYREPLGNLNNFLKIKNFNDLLFAYKNDAIFKEGTLLASPSLVSSIKKLDQDFINKKKIRKIRRSLFQYYSRYNTRTTPFGIFSCVGIGNFIDNIRENDKKNYYKKVNADSLWMYKLYNKIKNDPDVYKNINLIINNALQKNDNYWFLDTRTNGGLTKDNNFSKDIKIRSNNLIDRIMYLARKPIKIQKLTKIISKEFSLPAEKVFNFIKKLERKELLISEFNFSLISTDPLVHLINLCEKYHLSKSFIDELEDIKQLMKQYENLELGNGEELIKELKYRMENLVENKEYLRVDLFNSQKKYINLDLKKSLEEVIAILDSISFDTNSKEVLKQYHEQFIGTYGYEQLVPIQQLLNSSSGIGFPSNYEDKNEKLLSNQRNNKIKNFFLREIADALNKNKSIKLTKNKVKEFGLDENFRPGQLSGDLYTLYDKSTGRFELSGANISPNVGASFGRFYNGLGNDIMQKNSDLLNKTIHKTFADTIIAQIDEIPYYGRSANVQMCNDLDDMKLELRNYSDNSKKSILLSDIYVGATSEELYFYSKKYKKKIIFVMNNMFNYQKGSKLLRFLIEVSNFKFSGVTPIISDIFDEFKHTPAVMYKNIVLRPETWNIKEEEISSVDDLKKWICKNNVPNLVKLKYFDHTIYLNLHRQIDLKILYENIKKYSLVELLKATNKNRNIELVIPFINKNVKSNMVNYVPENIYSVNNVDRNYFYVKLIINKDNQNAFIKNELFKLLNYLGVKGQDKWFFIRYKEEGKDSIRLRIKCDETQKGDLYLKFTKYMPLLYKTFTISDFQVTQYIPEIYRYGGEKYLCVIHDFFYFDSILAILIIKQNKHTKIFTALSILYFLKNIGLTINEQRFLISNLYNPTESNREYEKKYHESINKIVNHLYNHDDKTNVESFCDKNMKDITLKLKVMLKNSDLTTSKWRIIGSLIHMRCNRVFGINSKVEKEIMFIVNKILASKRYELFLNEVKDNE